MANAFVPLGPAVQCSGGETGCKPPSHVYFFGMGAPGANAGLVSANDEPESVNAASSAKRITPSILAGDPRAVYRGKLHPWGRSSGIRPALPDFVERARPRPLP